MKVETLTNVTYTSGATAKKLTEILETGPNGGSAQNGVQTQNGVQAQTAVQAQNGMPGQAGELPKDYLDKVIKVANDAFQPVNIGFKYSVDKRTNIEVVEVYNNKTDEKIRQFPPEEIVNFLGKMYDMLGFLVDKKV
jgi:flagellar protein FlaG